MGHWFLGVLKTCFWKPAILFTQHFVDYFLSGMEAKIEPFCSNNHDIHCRFGTNASKITHLSFSLPLSLSLKVADQLYLSSALCYLEWLGMMGQQCWWALICFRKELTQTFKDWEMTSTLKKKKKMISHFSEFRDGWKNRNEENQGKNS